MRFEGKVAIVTGGTSGIGKEVAARFIKEGGSAVIHGRKKEKADAVAKEIDPTGKHVAVYVGEIAQKSVGDALVEIARNRFGKVDVLINNAGIFSPKPFVNTTEEEYRQFIGGILDGTFFASQAAVKAMQAAGNGGAIVNTGSMWALRAIGATPSAAYSVAKAGVHALVRNLAIELAKDKIRVNAVAPGLIENTNVLDGVLTPEQIAGAAAAFRTVHPLGRNGQPAEAAEAILFLASEQASFITGVVLPVDGGVMAGHA